jgi:hypothetical protein
MLYHDCLQDRQVTERHQYTAPQYQNELQRRGSGDQQDRLFRMDEPLVHSQWNCQHLLNAQAGEALSNHVRQLEWLLRGAHTKGQCAILQGQTGIALHQPRQFGARGGNNADATGNGTVCDIQPGVLPEKPSTQCSWRWCKQTTRDTQRRTS